MTSGYVFRENDRGTMLVAALAVVGSLTLPRYTLALAEGVTGAAAERPEIWFMVACLLGVAALAVMADPAPRAAALMLRVAAAFLLAFLATALVELLVSHLSGTGVGIGAATMASIAAGALILGIGLFAIWRASGGMIVLALASFAILFQAAVLVQGRAILSLESLTVPAGVALATLALAVIRTALTPGTNPSDDFARGERP